MTRSEMRHLERLDEQQASRIARLEAKIDRNQETCVGCSKAFGALTQQAADTEKGLNDHRANHRWHAGFAATIAGVIVAVAGFLSNLFWRR